MGRPRLGEDGKPRSIYIYDKTLRVYEMARQNGYTGSFSKMCNDSVISTYGNPEDEQISEDVVKTFVEAYYERKNLLKHSEDYARYQKVWLRSREAFLKKLFPNLSLDEVFNKLESDNDGDSD